VELADRGWSDEHLINLAGRNFLKVFKAVEDWAMKAYEPLLEVPFSPQNRTCRVE
jgi:hypothetical protein